jgi:hypothetical protein
MRFYDRYLYKEYTMSKTRVPPFDRRATALRGTLDQLLNEFGLLRPAERQLLENEILRTVASSIWHARTVLAATQVKQQEDLIGAARLFYEEFAKMWFDSELT